MNKYFKTNANKIFYKVMVRLVQDLSNIKKIVNEEGLDVLVVSYGGSCSNTLVNTLQKNENLILSMFVIIELEKVFIG